MPSFYQFSQPPSFVLVAQTVKNPLAMRETWVQSLGWEDPLEEGMATHPNILAWRTPWTEESSRLQSMGSQRATKNSTSLFQCTYNSTSIKGWNRNPILSHFLRSSTQSPIFFFTYLTSFSPKGSSPVAFKHSPFSPNQRRFYMDESFLSIPHP